MTNVFNHPQMYPLTHEFTLYPCFKKLLYSCICKYVTSVRVRRESVFRGPRRATLFVFIHAYQLEF